MPAFSFNLQAERLYFIEFMNFSKVDYKIHHQKASLVC